MAAAKNEQVIEIRPIELETVSLKELNAFKAKYKQLTELQSVFEAIDQIEIMEEQG